MWLTMLDFQLHLPRASVTTRAALNTFLEDFSHVFSERLCSISSFPFGYNLNREIAACKNILLLSVELLVLLFSL